MGNTDSVRFDRLLMALAAAQHGQTGSAQPSPATPPAGPQWVMQVPKIAGEIAAQPPAKQILVPTPKLAGRFISTQAEPWTTTWIKRPAAAVISRALCLVSRTFVSEIQTAAPAWVHELKPNQPIAWMLTHQTSLDAFYMFKLQTRLPFIPDILIASRKFWSAGPPPFVYFLNRKNMGEGKGNPVLEAKLDAENAANLHMVQGRFRHGGHTAAFPEGTTMKDGTVGYAKSGTFGTTLISNPDGTISYVPIGIVGNTLDLLAGPGNKSLAFVRVGEKLIPEPLQPFAGETPEAYEKRNGNAWSKRVGEAMIRAQTITPSQIVGCYLLDKAKRGDTAVSFKELHQELARQSAGYIALGLNIDEQLRDNGGRLQRTKCLWKNLQRKGYIKSDGDGGYVINPERVTREAIDTRYSEREAQRFAKYRSENPLRWCANQLLQIARHNPAAEKVLQGA